MLHDNRDLRIAESLIEIDIQSHPEAGIEINCLDFLARLEGSDLLACVGQRFNHSAGSNICYDLNLGPSIRP